MRTIGFFMTLCGVLMYICIEPHHDKLIGIGVLLVIFGLPAWSGLLE